MFSPEKELESTVGTDGGDVLFAVEILQLV